MITVRFAAQRAALREIAGHHEGEEEAARMSRRSMRSASSAGQLIKTVKTDPPPQRPERHHGEGRGGVGGRTQEEGFDLMRKILIIGEHDGKTLNPATAKCVTCAKSIPDADITIALLGADTAAVAAQAAALAT